MINCVYEAVLMFSLGCSLERKNDNLPEKI